MELIKTFLNHLLSYSPAEMGQFGDYVGGVIGTGISLFALIYVARTFKATQATSYFLTTQQSVYQMIQAYDRAADEITLPDTQEVGRAAITHLLNEFVWIYACLYVQNAKRNDPARAEQLEQELNWIENNFDQDEEEEEEVHEEQDGDALSPAIFFGKNVAERLSITYMFLYYGNQIHAFGGIPDIPEKALQEALVLLIRRNAKKLNGKYLTGHQRRLGHYFRTLYAIYSYIESREHMSPTEKYTLGKQVRIRLSNYEQGLLALNIISPLGRAWQKNELLVKYQPIKNLPERFFRLDDDVRLKELFPDIRFEFEEGAAAGQSLTHDQSVRNSQLSRFLARGSAYLRDFLFRDRKE